MGLFGRLQQQSEFDCVVKAFVYLTAHVPWNELLEPAMDEFAFDQIMSAMQNIMAISTSQKTVHSFISPDVDMSGIEAVLGRSSAKDAAVGMPLCEAEPDMFPCLVTILGSAFAFMKVCNILAGRCCAIIYLVARVYS